MLNAINQMWSSIEFSSHGLSPDDLKLLTTGAWLTASVSTLTMDGRKSTVISLRAHIAHFTVHAVDGE